MYQHRNVLKKCSVRKCKLQKYLHVMTRFIQIFKTQNNCVIFMDTNIGSKSIFKRKNKKAPNQFMSVEGVWEEIRVDREVQRQFSLSPTLPSCGSGATIMQTFGKSGEWVHGYLLLLLLLLYNWEYGEPP